MTTDPRSLFDLQADTVRLLGKYRNTRPEERTPVIRDVAKALVAARTHFLTDDAEPDYRGATRAYRQWVHNLYDMAHISPAERQTMQSSVRYHVGSVLREELDAETLERYGLGRRSPKERSAQRNATRNALLSALNDGSLQRGDLLALSATLSMMSTIRGEDFVTLTEAERATVDRSLAEIGRRVFMLRKMLGYAEEAGGAPRTEADDPHYTADE